MKDNIELRKFGLVVGGVFILLSIYLFWKEHTLGANILAVIGAILFVLGLVLPSLLFYVHKVWMKVAFFIGHIVTAVILSFVFYIFFTSYHLFMMLIKRDRLDLRPSSNRKSYWNYREKEINKESYERQY